MIVTKTSNINDFNMTNPKSWPSEIDIDLKNICLALQGRIRFGPNLPNNNNGENIMGQFVTYTTNSTPNTQDTVSHQLGSIPIGYIVISKSAACDVYQQSNTGTTWTKSNLYLKATASNVTVTLFLIQ